MIEDEKTKNIDTIYKYAGFKTPNGFELHCNYKVRGKDPNVVSVYGKINGKANMENKYDFPPPIDNTLFFGSCLLIMKQNDEPKDLTIEMWKKIYEQLFGGFEDINAGGGGGAAAASEEKTAFDVCASHFA